MEENKMKNKIGFLPAEGGPPISLRLGGRASMPMAGLGGIFGDDGTVPEVFYKKHKKNGM